MKFGVGLGVCALCAAFCHPANAQSSGEGPARGTLNLNPPGMTLHLADRYHLLPNDIDSSAGDVAAPDADAYDAHDAKAGAGKGEVRPAENNGRAAVGNFGNVRGREAG